MTVAPVVPPLILFLAKHPMVNNYKLSSLVDVISGGAPVGEELMTALRKRLPHIKIVRQGNLHACREALPGGIPGRLSQF